MINARIYSSILLVILFMGITASCTYDSSFVGEDSDANVTLTLSVGKQAINASRATDAENVINSVELFFYKKANDADTAPLENATCDVHISNSQLTTNANGTTTVSFTMPANGFNNLFGIGTANTETTCFVYAIANRGDNALPTDLTFSSVKKTVLTANFVDNEEEQTSFVMDGLAQVSRDNNSLSGTISLERVAVKIGLTMVNAGGTNVETLTATDSETNEQFTATPNDVKISLRRGSSKTYVGSTHYNADGTPVAEEYIYPTQATDIFSTEFYPVNTLFYTYPTNWETNDNTRTYLMLSVVWTSEKDLSTKKTYYEINVNPAGSFTQRNCFYQIEQQISVLGNEEEEKPLPVTNYSYKVLEWHAIEDEKTYINTDAELSRPKYLVVDETAVTMENTVTKKIYFNSSDPIDLVNDNDALTVKWHYTKFDKADDLPFANNSNADKSELPNGDIQYVVSNETAVSVKNNNKVSSVPNRIQGDYKVTITIHNANENDDNDQSYIEVTHPLDNTLDKEADYTQYYIEFSVQHKDDSSYKETIKITQYPMISIFADQNTTYTSGEGKGYVYVNRSNSSSSNWESVVGSLDYNKCPNRYITSVSTLNDTPEGRKYIIGDPRTNSRKITGTAEDLSKYLPTDRDERTRNMISPQFMFASSYGACPGTMTIDEAERRCATYQEDGYPAGRWRLPTEAEIKFVVQLKDWELIPELFSESMNYWSAHGKINGKAQNNGNNGSERVRCVYDTWYWGTDRIDLKEGYKYDDTRD